MIRCVVPPPHILLAHLSTLLLLWQPAVRRCNLIAPHLTCIIYQLLSVLGHLCYHHLGHLQKSAQYF